jgi:signal transduction histidine kinase
VENQSDSSNVREQSRLNNLKIYCDKKAGAWLAGFSFFSPYLEDQTSRKSAADYIITKDKDFISIESGRNGLTIAYPITNFSAKLIYSNLFENVEISKNNLTDTYKTDIKKLFKKCNTLGDLLLNINSVTAFKSFLSCQVLIHEKGKSLATSISKDRDKNLEKTNLTVSSFNNIFSKIKKSKNKLFDQTDILSDDIQVVGSFLAKEFNFTNHSMIFILSREDFFSPSDLEREYFDQFLTLSLNDISNLVAKYATEDKLEYFRSLIKSFPFYIKVSSDEGFVASGHDKPEKLVEKQFKNIHIEYDSLLELQSDPDYYHHERLVLMGELLNTLRHELSNPLFGINISTNLLLSDTFEKDTEVIQTIEEVGKSSERCQSIIENFSGLYGDRNLQQSINLKELISETLTLTKSESKQFQRKINFNNISEEVEVYTNPTYLSQIIFNLIINSSQALKAFEQEQKSILINIDSIDDKVRINISDNGPGIPLELRPKIFDAFYTTKESGTGLGLSICKNLSHKINAKLVLEDTEVGASFSLILPMEK